MSTQQVPDADEAKRELAAAVEAARRVADAAAQVHTTDSGASLGRTRHTEDGALTHPPRAPAVVEDLPAQIGRYTAAGLHSDAEKFPESTGVVYVAADERVVLRDRPSDPGWTIRVVPVEPRDGPFEWASLPSRAHHATIRDAERAVEALREYLRGGSAATLAYYADSDTRTATRDAEASSGQSTLADL
jgi:hypothetical protein